MRLDSERGLSEESIRFGHQDEAGGINERLSENVNDGRRLKRLSLG